MTVWLLACSIVALWWKLVKLPLRSLTRLASVHDMTASEMARKRWARTTPEQRSAQMRALAKRMHLLRPTRTWFGVLEAMDSRLSKIEAILSETTESRSGVNARLLDDKR